MREPWRKIKSKLIELDKVRASFVATNTAREAAEATQTIAEKKAYGMSKS